MKHFISIFLVVICATTNLFSMPKEQADYYGAGAGLGMGAVVAGLIYQAYSYKDKKNQQAVIEECIKQSEDAFSKDDVSSEHKTSMLKKIVVSLIVGSSIGYIARAILIDLLTDRKIDLARRVLGVSWYTSSHDIKKKYKTLAMKYHPDRACYNNLSNEEATKKFYEISEAYKLLIE